MFLKYDIVLIMLMKFKKICYLMWSNKVFIIVYCKVYFDGCGGFVDIVVVNEDKLWWFG